jgi:glutamate-1-semialdehyde 2,1-aminomutase
MRFRPWPRRAPKQEFPLQPRLHPVPVEATAYRSEKARSRALYARAKEVMPGGNSRHSVALSPYPIYVRSGRGCRVTDVEGQERIDFLNNFTSLILGHADPEVVAAVQERASLGTAFTMPSESDVELAELIVERVPYVDQVRFCNSGTEAVMLAVKAARAYTGRPKIAKFEGAYHGTYDFVEVSEAPIKENWRNAAAPASVIGPGSPSSVANEVVVLPWNNIDACRDLIAAHHKSLAAVVVDALPSGIGMIAPREGFLRGLREITAGFGILLVSDEVMSFRLSYHGAIHPHRIGADLAAFGKIIGGGFPVGAVGGSRQVMSVFDHTGDYRVHHGGTFNANPVTMAAGLATMRRMTPDAFDHLNQLGDSIREQLRRMFRDSGVSARVCGQGSLFLAHLTENELLDFRSITGYSRTNPVYAGLCHEMLANGIVSGPRGLFGCISTPMTEAELEAFVDAVERSLRALRDGGGNGPRPWSY